MEKDKLTHERILERGNKRMVLSDLELLEQTARQICAQTYVEIGAMDGCSSLLLGKLAAEYKGHLYSIEPRPRARWRMNLRDCGIEDSVTLVQAASPWIPDGSVPEVIDYLLIDGDHRTRWAIVDYHFFFPFVRFGGMIAFHDWNGRKGVAAWVRRAVELILEDDADKLKQVAVNQTKDRGIIIFQKVQS